MKKEYLSVSLNSLDLKIHTSRVYPWIQEAYSELRARDLRFKPDVWIGDEWFSPSDYPGVSVPFYLCDTKLLSLQRQHLYIAEGASRSEFLKILRHEFGHAYETAFSLSARKSWQKVFGNPNKPYPRSYRPNPFSDKHVTNIRYWYAQAHPHEDFAETFAVWLRPDLDWRKRYRRQKKVLEKLEYVDILFAGLKGKAPKIKKTTLREGDIRKDSRTVQQYIRDQQKQIGLGSATNFDEGLRKLFSSKNNKDQSESMPAYQFLRKQKVSLRKKIATWTSAHPYLVDLMLEDMIQRCKELDIHTFRNQTELWDDSLVFLTSQIMLHLGRRSYRISL